VKTVEEMGPSDLNDEQIKKLCTIAEEAARKHVLSKVPSKKVEILNICAEAEDTKPLKLTVDVDVTLSSSVNNIGVKGLCDDAVKCAFSAAEEYLRKLKCLSKK
jgi:hypothetical protein